mmetsp:Transcript_11483/g.34023  ORF Transcript_11483/g.34023 Transcript_11483/m.34023 type:complete len:451 (-) Transcript_11483:164-1516(-)
MSVWKASMTAVVCASIVPTSILCALSSTYSRLFSFVIRKWLPPGFSGICVTAGLSSPAPENGDADAPPGAKTEPAAPAAAVGVPEHDASSPQLPPPVFAFVPLPVAAPLAPPLPLVPAVAPPSSSAGAGGCGAGRLEWWKLHVKFSKMSPSMSMSSSDMSERNSVGSSSCRSMRLSGMPSSSFQNGSAKLRLSVMVPSSLARAALSKIALAMKSPTKWNFLMCDGLLDSGLMYSWSLAGPQFQNRSGELREMAVDSAQNHSRVTPPLSMPASPTNVTLTGCRHTAEPFPENTATLSLKHRPRRISILCTGPSTPSFATSSRNSLRRMRKSWRTHRRLALDADARGCSGSISVSSTCSQLIADVPARPRSRTPRSLSSGRTSRSSERTPPGVVHDIASRTSDVAHSSISGDAGRRGTMLSSPPEPTASRTALSSPNGPCSVSSCSSTTPSA